MSTKLASKRRSEPAQAGSLDAVGGRREWEICLKNPMWRGWKSLVRMYGCTREHAEAEAKRAIHYYEGSTAWKVKPSNDRTERRGTATLENQKSL